MATKSVSKAILIRDAKQVALTTDEVLTRDYLRQHSQFSDKQRAKFFTNHDALLVASGLKAVVTEATPAEKLVIEQAKLEAKQGDGKKLLTEAVKKISALEKEK